MNHQLADIIIEYKVHTRISHVFGTSYSITLETSCFYSKASSLKFILLFAMLHVLGGRDNFDITRLQPVQTTRHIVQLVYAQS